MAGNQETEVHVLFRSYVAFLITDDLPSLRLNLKSLPRPDTRFVHLKQVVSIFVVVFVAATTTTLLANAPVIFLQQAELSEGQVRVRHFNSARKWTLLIA